MAKFVLVVEPDEDSRDAICELLADCGAPLRCAADYVEGISLLGGATSPCAVVLACGPREVESAKRAVALLRMNALTVDVPVIALSTIFGLAPFDDRTTVLEKPHDVPTLRAVVCSAAARCSH